MTPRDWDDDRLHRAFAARAAASRPIQSDLPEATMSRVRASPRQGLRYRELGIAAGLAATVLAVAIIVVGGNLGRPIEGAAASRPTEGAIASTASSASGSPPASVPVSSVAEAIAIRDRFQDDRELVVAGWFVNGPTMFCALFAGPANPTWMPCSPPWLMNTAEQTGATGGDRQPQGPAFHPSFALVGPPVLPAPADAGGAGSPISLMVVGHFHDRRAVLCPASARSECGQVFLVDRIASVCGAALPVSTTYALDVQVQTGNTVANATVPPTSLADDLDAQILSVAPAVTVLSRRVMSLDALAEAEPALRGGWAGLGTAVVVTSVIALDPGGPSGPARARTFLSPERGGLYEMTAVGPVAVQNQPVQGGPPDLLSMIGELTVSEAISLRDHTLDDTELLVRGFAWWPGGIGCPMLLPRGPVLDQCESKFTWLAEDKPPLAQAQAHMIITPIGPAFNLLIEPETYRGNAISTSPTDEVVVGHFDDRRALACPATRVEQCRRNFVVDAILDPADTTLHRSTITVNRPDPDAAPEGNVDWAASVAGLVDPFGADHVIALFPVRATALQTFEPAAAGAPDLAGVDVVWVVRFLGVDPFGRPAVRTRLVADATPGSGQVRAWDVSADGISRTLARPP